MGGILGIRCTLTPLTITQSSWVHMQVVGSQTRKLFVHMECQELLLHHVEISDLSCLPDLVHSYSPWVVGKTDEN